MKKNMLVIAWILTSTVTSAFAGIVHKRCEEDILNTNEQVKGRNAWARKCGYLDPDLEGALTLKGLYLVFEKGSLGGDPNIPASENEACISALEELAFCYKGCYTGSQRLMFGGQLIPIESAADDQGIREITTLSNESSKTNLKYQSHEIEDYTSGETEEEIYILSMENGTRLEITADHPVVNSEFVMVKAKELRPGESLIHMNGDLVRIRSIDIVPFKGRVWNVQPNSLDKLENVVLAEAFLMGSSRFQNQWANDFYRLSLRDSI